MKVGIMDEERRTHGQPQGLHPERLEAHRFSINIPAFLDRTGDEISIPRWKRGPMIRKERHEGAAPGSRPYEDWNVDVSA